MQMRCLRYGAKGRADLRTARKLIDEYRDDLYNAGKGGGIMAKNIRLCALSAKRDMNASGPC